MEGTAPIPRSLLFVPGDSERKMVKAIDTGPDAIILDLEDSVAVERLPFARELVRNLLDANSGQRASQLWVRINPLATPQSLADLSAAVGGSPNAILVPKTVSGSDIAQLSHMLDILEVREGVPGNSIGIMPVATETAHGMFALGSYRASSPRLIGLTWGAEDIAAVVGATSNRRSDGAYDDLYRLARTLCLVGAKSAGVAAIDTIWADFRDSDGLRGDAEAARRMGFSGKIAIHPDQVAVIHEAFAPSMAEIDHARRVVEMFAASGTGTVGMDGKMLDLPHLKQAQNILASASYKAGPDG
jgi:citrate lyase subunit beta/citryl-CoA lyase